MVGPHQLCLGVFRSNCSIPLLEHKMLQILHHQLEHCIEEQLRLCHTVIHLHIRVGIREDHINL
jgi:hypothetical protein